MRIAIFDNWGMKFSHVLKEYWESLGHTVVFEPGFNPNLIETCDRVFFESADTNVHLATQQRPYKKGKVFVRVVDVDALVNGPAGIREGYMDGIIYIADHIKDFCQKFDNLKETPQIVIPMGVDLNKFTYREKDLGKKIAFISTRLTYEKGFDKALSIFTELRKHSSQWELHVVGRMFENNAWQLHVDHHIKQNNLQDHITFYGNLPYDQGNEINTFLEDKDYILLSSYKEAFSFTTAEAMSKGIKPVVYNFNGAENVWKGANITYNTEREAVDNFLSPVYTPKLYRKYVEDNYSLEKHLKAMSSFMGI